MSAIERLVRSSTKAQGLPERLEDPSTARRVAVLLDRPPAVGEVRRDAA